VKNKKSISPPELLGSSSSMFRIVPVNGKTVRVLIRGDAHTSHNVNWWCAKFVKHGPDPAVSFSTEELYRAARRKDRCEIVKILKMWFLNLDKTQLRINWH
jgi:hypothetical protein